MPDLNDSVGQIMTEYNLPKEQWLELRAEVKQDLNGDVLMAHVTFSHLTGSQMETTTSNYPKGQQEHALSTARAWQNSLHKDFEYLATAIHAIAVDHGWWDAPRNTGEMIALMHSELSECLEGIRKPHQDEHCPEFTSEEIELADTIIRILDFATARNLRLVDAIYTKMSFNADRPFMHGGKAF